MCAFHRDCPKKKLGSLFNRFVGLGLETGDNIWRECRCSVSRSSPDDSEQRAALSTSCPAEPALFHPTKDQVRNQMFGLAQLELESSFLIVKKKKLAIALFNQIAVFLSPCCVQSRNKCLARFKLKIKFSAPCSQIRCTDVGKRLCRAGQLLCERLHLPAVSHSPGRPGCTAKNKQDATNPLILQQHSWLLTQLHKKPGHSSFIS